MVKTVKARVHHGAKSLNLTVPADIVRDHDINEGDIFRVHAREEDGEVVVEYCRIYKSE